MKIVHELRERKAFEQPKSASPIPIVLGAMIAFGIGMLGVSGLVKTPSFIKPKPKQDTVAMAATPAPAEVTVNTGGHRIGRAETAPLLRSCTPFAKLGMEPIRQMHQISNAELYRLLQTASTMTRLAAAAGIEGAGRDGVQFASAWGDVADCVYRQNGWALCDPDNRALAVEAATSFVRQVQSAEKELANRKADNSRAGARHKQDQAYAMQNALSIKSRLLSSIRNRASEGRLVASDFGMFAPTEILQAVRGGRVTSDACAARQ